MPDPIIHEIDFGQQKDPIFRVKFPQQGESQAFTRDYEPFSLIEKLEAIDANSPANIVAGAVSVAQGADTPAQAKRASFFGQIRELFALPQLTAHQCMILLVGLQGAIAEAKVTKDMEELNAKAKEREAKK